MNLRDRMAALLGISAYSATPPAVTPSESTVEETRERFGGQLAPIPTSRTRWYLADLESALFSADSGDLSRAAQLYRALLSDGVLAGVLSTRTGGIVGLPKRFTGNEEIIRVLEGRDGASSVFDAMFPPAELELLADDGVVLGVGVGELVPVEGRDYPVFVRLDPEWLQYRWQENRWYYQSVAGPLPITPGDGRWVLHVPGGRVSPWHHGLWRALGRSWINKTHASLHQSNWEAKLANPARVASAPSGATEAQRSGFLERVIAWGINTVFELPPGWEVKLIESNGRGFESFGATMDRAETEYMIAIAGQVVTTTGGTGFANADVHKSVRADLIKSTADGLAHTINTQGLPSFIVERWGLDALEHTAILEWDTKPPKDLKSDGEATTAFGTALTCANAALAPYGLKVDALEFAARFGVPLLTPEEEAAIPDAVVVEDDPVTESDDESTGADVIDIAAARVSR